MPGQLFCRAGPSRRKAPASNSDAGLIYEEKLWADPSYGIFSDST